MIAGLHYELGGREDGPVVLFSSGLGGSGSYWAPNLPAFAKSYRTLTYDQRGTGRSDRALQEPLTIEAMADDILALLDGLGIGKVHLVGHALGGIIGLALALKAPERLDRIVVINGWATPDPHLLRCFETRLALLADSGPRAFLRAQPIFLYPATWISQNSAQIEAEEPHHLAAMPAPAAIARRIQALLAFDASTRLREIPHPVLALAAADDMLTPATTSARLAEALPNGRLVTMAWGGHACNVTHPAGFDRLVLDFLATRPTRRSRFKGVL